MTYTLSKLLHSPVGNSSRKLEYLYFKSVDQDSVPWIAAQIEVSYIMWLVLPQILPVLTQT